MTNKTTAPLLLGTTDNKTLALKPFKTFDVEHPQKGFFFAQTTKGGSNTIIIINKNISISLPIGSSLRRATKCNRCLQGNSVVFTLSGLGLAVCNRASQRSEYI